MSQSFSRIPWTYKPGSDGRTNTLIVYLDGKPHVILSSNSAFAPCMNAVKANDKDALRRILSPKQALLQSSDGKFQLYEDTLLYAGVPVGEKMFNRILAVFHTGLDCTPIMNFFANLHENPSEDARNECYLFLEHNDLPITEDGYFLAYKMIRDDWKDLYSGTMDNSIGAVVEMPRDQCETNRNVTCSRGLHFCSRSYIGSGYGNGETRRLVVVKINPRDVVSIPSDYNNAKGRACKYVVIEQIKFSDHLPDNFRPDQAGYDPDADNDGLDGEDDTCPGCGNPYDDCSCEEEPDAPEETSQGGVTDETVRNIRKALKDPNFKTLTQVGKAFNLHRTTIQRIRDGITHTHVI